MSMKHFEMTADESQLIVETIVNARKQKYTPEKLCDLQKIIDAQYFYWWMNDMKVEEQAKKLFRKPFNAYCTGFGGYQSTPLSWAKNAKFCNAFMTSSHMGHNPMVWFMDETHARGVFLFESHFTYNDNPEDLVELFLVYVDDFEKDEDGQWNISDYRLIQTKLSGEQRPETLLAPEDYKIPGWDEV